MASSTAVAGVLLVAYVCVCNSIEKPVPSAALFRPQVIRDQCSVPHHLCLRGGGWGWPKIEVHFGERSSSKQEVREVDTESAASSHEHASRPGDAAGAAAASAAPQVSLISHAMEYAIAGGMDGIRSGVGQGVGGEFAHFVQSSFRHGAGIGKFAGQLAFANVLRIIPHLRNRQGKSATCPLSQGAAVHGEFAEGPNNQIPGITSVYMWEGRVNRDSEVLLVMKTCRSKVASVAALIKEKHPYIVPELVVMDVIDGLPDYLEWVRNAVAAKSTPP